MTLLQSLAALAGQPAALALTTAALGAMVGSFLNVVILRLPRILEAQWQRDAREALQPEAAAAAAAPSAAVQSATPPLSLSFPPSHCPKCLAPIRPWHNVPLLSWLLLRGRCAACRAPISIQYPLVEAASALLSAACALHFGWTPQLGAALVCTWMLLALAVIDLNTQLLPDDLTLPLLWLGLLASIPHWLTTPDAAILGAAAGYASLWAVYQAFRLLTGREGMGYGDFKLMAALGAWLGWRMLPEIVLLSSLVGAVVGLGLMAARRVEFSSRIPFGPYIAGAGWIALLWGEALRNAYWGTFGGTLGGALAL